MKKDKVKIDGKKRNRKVCKILGIAILCLLIVTIILGIQYKNRPRTLDEKTAEQMEAVFNQATKSDLVQEAVLYVESTDGSFSYTYGYGDRDIDDPMICASVTKMFTTTCILKLCEEGKLSLDDKVSEYFDASVMDGLLVYNGVNYAYDLTVSNLLFQNSGLPDRYEDGGDDPIADGDFFDTFDQEIARAKEDGALFIPGTEGKAHYSNINFDMLGVIITEVTGKSLSECFQEMVFTPAGMTATYLLEPDSNCELYTYYESERIYRPQVLASSGAAGGAISTPRDLMTFSKAFWGGELFDAAVLDELTIYNGLQADKGPINYGGGYMEIPLDGSLTSFLGEGELIGHCGCTGSFAFYYPEQDLHIVGDLTEITNPALPIRLLIKLAML